MSSVELTRETDGPGLIAALAHHGLQGALVGGQLLAVQVEDCDEGRLAHAIEDWIRDGNLPLVPFRLGDCAFAVSPPAG